MTISTASGPGEPVGTRAVGHLVKLPVSAFASVMGIAGLGLAWCRAHGVVGAPDQIGHALLLAAGFLYLVLMVGYLAKAIVRPASVAVEFHDPSRIGLFGAIAIGPALLAAGWVSVWPTLALVLWACAVPLQLVISIWVVRTWVDGEFRIDDANPNWFVPMVGNVVLVFAAAPLGFVDVAWACFGVGLVFWLVVLVLVLARLTFREPMPDRRLPGLTILIAPPALCLTAYVALTGRFDAPALMLQGIGVFLSAIVLTLAPKLLRAPFGMAWWSFTFPTAALAGALLAQAEVTGDPWSVASGSTVLVLSTATVAWVTVRTVLMTWREFRPVAEPVSGGGA